MPIRITITRHPRVIQRRSTNQLLWGHPVSLGFGFFFLPTVSLISTSYSLFFSLPLLRFPPQTLGTNVQTDPKPPFSDPRFSFHKISSKTAERRQARYWIPCVGRLTRGDLLWSLDHFRKKNNGRRHCQRASQRYDKGPSVEDLVSRYVCRWPGPFLFSSGNPKYWPSNFTS